MANTLRNPEEESYAIIEGKSIDDIDLSTMESYEPAASKSGYRKCYIQNNTDAAIQMDIEDMTGVRKVSTFLPGITSVGIQKIYAENSSQLLVTVIS